MSWVSKRFNRVVDQVAGISPLSGLVGEARTKEMIAAGLGGSTGWQNQYSRNKGMSDSEAQGNALTKGYSYKDYRTQQVTRQDAAVVDAQNIEFAKKKVLSERQQEGQIAARVRRSRYADMPGNKNGTIKSGNLGTPGNQALSFSQLLGL